MENNKTNIEKIKISLPFAPENAKIGILGGSFDPPHRCHQLLALNFLTTEPINFIWIMPCADHPMKKNLSNFNDRFNMCKLAFSKLGKKVKVIDVEKHLPPPNYTINTIKTILSVRPDIKISIGIGSDILTQLKKWKSNDELLKIVKIIVFQRKHFPVTKSNYLKKNKEIFINKGCVLLDIKSRQIKTLTKTKNKKKQIPFVDKEISEYIKNNSLYF